MTDRQWKDSACSCCGSRGECVCNEERTERLKKWTESLPPWQQSPYGQVPESDPSPCMRTDYSTSAYKPFYSGYDMGSTASTMGPGAVRVFKTGATRDTDANKLDYHGFLAPIVLERYAQYMHKHRVQSDGSLRDSDNWQKGMPPLQYLKSLIRHVVEFWRNPQQETACAILFNVMGWLYEDLRREPDPEP